MKKRISLLLVGSLCLWNFSCYYDQELVLPEVQVPDDVTISFKTDIEPLFSQSGKNCTACHNGGNIPLDLRVGNAYDEIVPDLIIPGNAEGSEFYQKLPGNSHPNVSFTLNGDEIALIKAWIDRGAENN